MILPFVLSQLMLGPCAFASEPTTVAGFNRETGVYEVYNSVLGWRLSGRVPGPGRDCRSVAGHDRNGAYRELSFTWDQGTPVQGLIRCYEATSAVKFRLHYVAKAAKPVTFPEFTTFPAGLLAFSYRDVNFAPASFALNQTSTPWLLLNERAQAMIFSPASNFMVAKMVGDGKSSIGESLDDRLREVPKGLDQDSLLVFDQGIQNAWDRWGGTLRKLYGRKAPAASSEPLLSSFGYWTDNGADYYYNYDADKGYAGTLLALCEHYREQQIPLAYLQLDSWWYQKSIDGADGKPGGQSKNSKLPPGSWNRYGGTMIYRAHPDLFPKGLAAFHEEVGLPLAVHARWMDRKSPYHEHYKISGVGVLDPAWWNDVAGYLSSSGVDCYEQDWLDHIYDNSPEMHNTVGVGDAFTDGMASACLARGLKMQYCMATPRFFLQGVKYPNLSTIRTSDDRFGPSRWAPFLYCSQLADGIGAWPWCDVFSSREQANMILSVLSGGPVGVGDAIGKEDRANIMKAVRADGVIVKPDRPLVPCDQTYIDGALRRKTPFLASTFTDHNGVRTRYFFGFPQSKEERTFRILPRYFGVDRESYLFDLVSGTGRVIDADYATDITIEQSGNPPTQQPDIVYLMIAPVTKTGLVFLGDLDQDVPTGKQRIASLVDGPDGLRVEVSFAAGERSVTLQGVNATPPKIWAERGRANLVRYDATTKRFAIEVSATPGSRSAAIAISGR